MSLNNNDETYISHSKMKISLYRNLKPNRNTYQVYVIKLNMLKMATQYMHTKINPMQKKYHH